MLLNLSQTKNSKLADGEEIYVHLNRIYWFNKDEVEGLVQDCSISSVLAIEILQSCAKPSECNTK